MENGKKNRKKKKRIMISLLSTKAVNTVTHHSTAAKMSLKTRKTMSHSSRKAAASTGQKLVDGSDSPEGV